MSFFTYFSIPAKEREKRIKSLIKLDRKEIRRSIAISFTILYIVLISFYFQEAKLVAKSLVDAPETVPMNTTLAAQDLTLTHFSNLITAFTTIYATIIAFYFGSRVYEKIKEIKDAEEALKIQYVMDEIDSDEFKKKMVVLKGTKPNSHLEILKPIKSADKKITIKHNSGDDIDLKHVKMIIEVDKEQIKIDPVAQVGKKDVFKAGETMVIDMKKIINRGDDVTDAIKIKEKPTDKGKSTGVKKGDICDGIKLDNWQPNNKVKVKVIYRTGELIIKEREMTIDP